MDVNGRIDLFRCEGGLVDRNLTEKLTLVTIDELMRASDFAGGLEVISSIRTHRFPRHQRGRIVPVSLVYDQRFVTINEKFSLGPTLVVPPILYVLHCSTTRLID